MKKKAFKKELHSALDKAYRDIAQLLQAHREATRQAIEFNVKKAVDSFDFLLKEISNGSN